MSTHHEIITLDSKDHMKHNKYNQRKEDTMFYKISRIAAIITAVGIITGATVKTLSYEFVKKEELKSCIAPIEIRLTTTEKDQVRIIQKLDDVGSDVKEIRKVLLRR